jgi:lipoprotein-anchoring transpeptidase ErfK/SrfK
MIRAAVLAIFALHAGPAALAQTPDRVAAIAPLPPGLFSKARTQQMLTVQVLLDRARFSPGVIDGLPGSNTARAISAFRQANGLPAGGGIDAALLKALSSASAQPVLTRYAIAPADVSGPFAESIPAKLEEKAELDRLAYTSPVELFAEKFHTSEALLRALNPGADFSKAGTEITVPAVRSGGIGGEVARIQVDKGQNTVRAYDSAGKLLASYPATVGSAQLPTPSGTTEVRAVAPDPAYYFDPEKLSWGPDRKLKIAPGPNNPVGGTWIDLAKPTYGIHGSPDPGLIGKTASHGCVRLTNWDAEELAKAVKPGTVVEFVSG